MTSQSKLRSQLLRTGEGRKTRLKDLKLTRNIWGRKEYSEISEKYINIHCFSFIPQIYTVFTKRPTFSGPQALRLKGE